VSHNAGGYFFELLLATSIQIINLGNIILLILSIPDEIMYSIEKKLSFVSGDQPADGAGRRVDYFPLSGAVWVVIIAGFLAYFSYGRHPHIPDEIMYLYQARYMAEGNLSVPAPSVPEAFSFYLIPYNAARWYSIFPPGWPAVLALGVVLGMPWMVNPVLGGLNILLLYYMFHELCNRRTARIAVILFCTSPWFVFMSMNFMSHTFMLTAVLIAAAAVIRARRNGNVVWGCIMGGAVGVVSLIRPLDGLIVAIVIGLWSLGIGGRRLKLNIIAAYVLSVLVVGAIIFPYNKQLTGSSTTFPLMAYYEEYHGHNSNALGFGPERGLGWALDPFPGHGPLDAVVNAGLNISSINTELFGWSTGSLIVVVMFLFSGGMKKNDYLLFMIMLFIAGTLSLYWFSGGPDFGARYWYLMIIPLVALTVRGIEFLGSRSEVNGETSSLNAKMLVAVLSLSLCSLVNVFPWRAIDKYHNYRGMRPDIRSLSQEYNFGRSLVLIQGDDADYESAWTYNPLDPQANAPLYAWARDPNTQNRLLKEYRDRVLWVVDGPSKTGAGYAVVRGPLDSYDMLLERKEL